MRWTRTYKIRERGGGGGLTSFSRQPVGILRSPLKPSVKPEIELLTPTIHRYILHHQLTVFYLEMWTELPIRSSKVHSCGRDVSDLSSKLVDLELEWLHVVSNLIDLLSTSILKSHDTNKLIRFIFLEPMK